MRTRILIPLLGLALLTGCATATPAATSGTPTLETTEAATPTPTIIPGDEDGNGKLSEFEKQILAKRNYVLVDGTTVPAPAQGEPVPAAIVENIKAIAGPAIGLMGNSATASDGSLAFIEVVGAEQERLGRTLIVVAEVSNGMGGSKWAAMTLEGPVAEGSKDASIAGATDLATRVPSYLVIVFD